MELKLYLFIKNLRDTAQTKVNLNHRWLRLRIASKDDISMPQYLHAKNWKAYCACDGSGIYNGAFGPIRTILQRRKKAHAGETEKSYHELIVDGHQITSLELRTVLDFILDNCENLVMALRATPIDMHELPDIIQTCREYDVNTDAAIITEIFTDSDQAVKVKRSRISDKSTHSRADRRC